MLAGKPGNQGHVKNKMFSSVDSLLLLAKCVQAHLQLQDLVNLGVWWEGWEVQPRQNPPSPPCFFLNLGFPKGTVLHQQSWHDLLIHLYLFAGVS